MKAKIIFIIILLSLFGCSVMSADIDHRKYKYADTWNKKLEALKKININDSITKIEAIFGKPRFVHKNGNQSTYDYTKTENFGCLEAIQIKFDKKKVISFETIYLCMDYGYQPDNN